MKKHVKFLVPVAAVLFATLMAGFSGNDYKSSGGAPAGYTNSPGDGQNCSHCMGGSAVAVTGWITSNIPATGYVPGATYTITATATGTGNKGFQVSPQDASGNLIGTLTAGTGNKLVGSNKYVTHTSAQSGDPATWNFQWTAPATAVGEVTFYGSLAVGKLNTKTTTLTVNQSTVGMVEAGRSAFSVFPVPAHDRITVAFTRETLGLVTMNLLSARGDKISTLMNEECTAGEHVKNFNLSQPAGLYFLHVVQNGQTAVKKVILE
jgi:hypothetical protein